MFGDIILTEINTPLSPPNMDDAVWELISSVVRQAKVRDDEETTQQIHNSA